MPDVYQANICLIWRNWLRFRDVRPSSMAEWRWRRRPYFAWSCIQVGRGYVASIDAKITFGSLSPPALCIFKYVCCIRTNTHLNLVFFIYIYIYIYMFTNFRVDLTPRETGNGYRNMYIGIFERECVCLQSILSPVTLIVNITLLLYYLCCIGEVRTC
jgi:hypothetical protein